MALQVTLVRHRHMLKAQCVPKGFQEREPKDSVLLMCPQICNSAVISTHVQVVSCFRWNNLHECRLTGLMGKNLLMFSTSATHQVIKEVFKHDGWFHIILCRLLCIRQPSLILGCSKDAAPAEAPRGVAVSSPLTSLQPARTSG